MSVQACHAVFAFPGDCYSDDYLSIPFQFTTPQLNSGPQDWQVPCMSQWD